jgi:hypothetical protein
MYIASLIRQAERTLTSKFRQVASDKYKTLQFHFRIFVLTLRHNNVIFSASYYVEFFPVENDSGHLTKGRKVPVQISQVVG